MDAEDNENVGLIILIACFAGLFILRALWQYS